MKPDTANKIVRYLDIAADVLKIIAVEIIVLHLILKT